MKTIYLDNAATTPLRPEVRGVMIPYLDHVYGNPSSMHHIGREAKIALEDARGLIASVLHIEEHEIIFTGSGTEANNLAIIGIARAYGARGKHILLSAIEHPSVLEAGALLARDGYIVEYLPVNHYGQVSAEEVWTRIRPDTILISIMLANNEIGTIQPIAEIAKLLKEKCPHGIRPIFHTDACQATGQITVTPKELGVDLMTLNSAKIYGPKGVGMLYVHADISLAPYLVGGHQEFGKRAGTENVASIVGFAHALSLSLNEQGEQQTVLTQKRDACISLLEKQLPQAVLNGHRTERLPNNIHVSFPYIEGESLVLMLDHYGICASTGSACSTHNLLPSHVLRATGQSLDIAHGSLRLTLGRTTTHSDLVYLVTALGICVARLEALSPLPLHI